MGPTPSLTPQQIEHFADSKQSALWGTLITFLVLGNGFLILRLVAQLKISKYLTLDDALLIVATLCANALLICTILATHYGLGLHIWRVLADDPRPPLNLVKIFQNIWVTSIAQAVCLLHVKLSLLFLYRRLFLVHQHWLQIAFYANFVYIILWFIGSLLFYILQCSPPSYYWNRFYVQFHSPKLVHGQCKSSTVNHVGVTLILSLISDAALLVLPIATLFTLQITRRKRIGLCIVFGFGVFALVIAMVRIIETYTDTETSKDPTYDTVSFLILSSAEVIVAIICACWPVVVPIFIKHVRETTRFLNTKPRRTGLNDGFSEIQSSDRGSAPELARAPRENATDGLGFEDGHDLQVFSEGHKGHLSLDPDEIHMTTDVEVRLDKRYPSRSKLLRNI